MRKRLCWLLGLFIVFSAGGCDQFAGAVRDGVLDFIESGTADLLEEVITGAAG